MREQGAERLLFLMTRLPDDMLDEAISYQKPASQNASPKVFWNKGALVAACLGLFLIGGLAWDALQDPLGGNKMTEAGISAGGIGGQTLAPTGSTGMDQTGAGGIISLQFWYDGEWYAPTSWTTTELPGVCVHLGTLVYEELSGETQAVMSMKDWMTQDPGMTGAKVFRMVGDYKGFFVETEAGYVYYSKASLYHEPVGETEGHS